LANRHKPINESLGSATLQDAAEEKKFVPIPPEQLKSGDFSGYVESAMPARRSARHPLMSDIGARRLQKFNQHCDSSLKTNQRNASSSSGKSAKPSRETPKAKAARCVQPKLEFPQSHSPTGKMVL
jgi:hypothetical protein